VGDDPQAATRVERFAHDVLELGRLAFAREPIGARVGLWQPPSHRGAH
jgi:hypothetical protein